MSIESIDKFLVIMVILCSLIIGLSVLALDSERKAAKGVAEMEEYTRLECHLVGDVTGDSMSYYTPLYFCKDKEKRRCMYAIRTHNGAAITLAPCFAANFEGEN